MVWGGVGFCRRSGDLAAGYRGVLLVYVAAVAGRGALRHSNGADAQQVSRSRSNDAWPLFAFRLFLLAGLLELLALGVFEPATHAVATFPFLLEGWTPQRASEVALLMLLGMMSAVYFVGVARAYQVAPASVIATSDYTYLVWAAPWGLLLFAEVPGL